MKDDIIKKAYIASFDIEDKSLKDLIIINTKCLVDNYKQRFVFVDSNRLKDELIYYRCYGETPRYNFMLNIILPVILSNTSIQKGEDESIALIEKYVKYFKKDGQLFEYILASVLYNGIMHNIIDDKNIGYEELLQKIKEKIICFSMELDKQDTIKFQMVRIKVIQKIDNYIDLKVDDYDDNEIISTVLNILYDIYIEDRQVKNDGMLSIKKSILSVLGEEPNLNTDNIDFILSMAEYIIKLRIYKINKKLYENNANPRLFINLNEGDNIVDPIFNKVTVISKNFINNILSIKIKSKSGTHVLKFKKS